MNVKEFYTAKELAELHLHSLPSFHANVRKRAEKEGWLSRPRSGRGGGLEYAFDSLPKAIQSEIKARELKALMTADTPKAVVVRGERDLDTLTHKDRRIADSRLMMAMLVERYACELGTQDKAIKYVSKLSRIGALPIEGATDYNIVCENAKARQEKTGVGVRKLHEWVLEARRCGSASDVLSVMSPAKQGRPQTNILSALWLPEFLKFYRNPNGLSVTRCYELWRYEYVQKHGMDLGMPSISQVRAMLKRIPPLERERGRLTGSKLKEIDSYIRRDWNDASYANNHIWVGDGHSLKCSVKHHKSGQAVMAEITLIIDAPSRYIVGYSLSYSESGMAVLSALRYAWARHGVNAIYYSDNGRGEKNVMLSDEVVGILSSTRSRLSSG